MFQHEMSQRLSQPGIAVGLAWTAMGGEIMFVEANRLVFVCVSMCVFCCGHFSINYFMQ